MPMLSRPIRRPVTSWPPRIPMRTNMTAPAPTAAMPFMPSQSLTRMSPGLPAIARRFSVRSLNDDEVIRETKPEIRAANGLTVRSKKGCWSSSSWRSFAVMAPSWVRRARSGSSRVEVARPIAIMTIATAAAPATKTANGIALDLDVHDLANEEEADAHHYGGEADQDDAQRDPDDLGRLLEHRVEERRRGKEDEEREGERQAADHVARHPLLGRQRPDLALDPDALADREGDRVEDLGEVAADLVLDRDRGGHQLEVLGLHASDHVLDRGVERQAEVDLADDPA